MSEPSTSPALRIVLHPATTIVFAIIGVVLGVVVIRNSAREESINAYQSATYTEQARSLSELKIEVRALQSQNDSLQKAVNGLAERLAEVESKLPANRKKAGKKQSKSP